MRSCLRAALATVMLVGCSSLGHSTTTTLQKQTSSIFGSNGSVSVVIYDDDYRPGGVGVLAGGFALQGHINQDTILDKFTAWCLDISRNLVIPSSYTAGLSNFVSTALTLTQVANVKRLFETSYSSLDLTQNVQSGGFQLALWEIVNEDSNVLDVKTGSFYVKQSLSAQNFANSLLVGLSNPVSQPYTLNFLQSNSNVSQNLVVGDTAVVPLPGAGLLLLSGVAGLAFLGRRRSSGFKGRGAA